MILYFLDGRYQWERALCTGSLHLDLRDEAVHALEVAPAINVAHDVSDQVSWPMCDAPINLDVFFYRTKL